MTEFPFYSLNLLFLFLVLPYYFLTSVLFIRSILFGEVIDLFKTIVYGELLALQLFLMIPLYVYPAVPEMSEFLECLCELISISATEQ